MFIKKNINKFINNKRLPLLLIFLFFTLRLKYFTTDIYFPDEYSHTFFMSMFGEFIKENFPLNLKNFSENLFATNDILKEYLILNNPSSDLVLNTNNSNILFKVFSSISNYEGFGAIYWISGGIISAISKDFRIFLRILSLFSICISAFYFYSSLKTDNIIKFFSTILFLTTPFFWYGGKLITPEFYIIPIIFYSYYKFTKNSNQNFSSLLFGFAVGIKSSILPALFPCFLYLQKNKVFKNSKKKIIFLLIFFIFGIIIASPNIIWDPFGYFNSIPKHFKISTLLSFKEFNLNLTSLLDQGFTIKREWDLVISSGYFKVIFPFLNLIIISLMAFFTRDISIFIKFFLSLILFFTLMFFQGNYVWHYFSLIPIVFFYFTEFINKTFVNERSKGLKKYLFPIIFSLIIINISNVNLFTGYDNNIRYKTFTDIKNFETTNTACIINYFNSSNEKDSVIIDSTGILKTGQGKQLLDSQKIADSIKQRYYSFIDGSGILKTYDGSQFRDSEKLTFKQKRSKLPDNKNYDRKNFYFLFYKPYKEIYNNGKSFQKYFLENYISPKIILNESAQKNKCRNIIISKLN